MRPLGSDQTLVKDIVSEIARVEAADKPMHPVQMRPPPLYGALYTPRGEPRGADPFIRWTYPAVSAAQQNPQQGPEDAQGVLLV